MNFKKNHKMKEDIRMLNRQRKFQWKLSKKLKREINLILNKDMNKKQKLIIQNEL